MSLSKGESFARRVVEAIYRKTDVRAVVEIDMIREEAIRTFTDALDERLVTLQEGESLQITYRVDVINERGVVRGGSGNRSRNTPAYTAWRSAVFQRDQFTCQQCGTRGELEAHHVLAWADHPEKRFDVANGLTLCVPCHRAFHTRKAVA